MNRYTIILFALFCGIIIAGNPQFLRADDRPASANHSDCIGNCPPYSSCPQCKVTCKGSVEKDTITRHYWDVECDYVCIPPVKFPWTKCCELPCPKIRKIHVMKRRDYKIDICKFHWKLKKIWPCCNGNSCATQ